MSLADTQELMRTMQELIAVLNNVEAKTEKLVAEVPKIQKAGASFREAERLALRYLAISRRMGLPDETGKQLEILAKVVVLIRMAQISFGLMSGNPIQVMIGFAGALSVGMSVKDMMQMG